MLGIQIPGGEDDGQGIILVTGIALASKKVPSKPKDLKSQEDNKVIDITPKK